MFTRSNISLSFTKSQWFSFSTVTKSFFFNANLERRLAASYDDYFYIIGPKKNKFKSVAGVWLNRTSVWGIFKMLVKSIQRTHPALIPRDTAVPSPFYFPL